MTERLHSTEEPGFEVFASEFDGQHVGPIIREDGGVVGASQTPGGGLRMEFGTYGPYYASDEVLHLGNGDYDAGVRRITEAYGSAPADYVQPGGQRIFQAILDTEVPRSPLA